MSECEKYQELISALLDSELSGAESAALAEHLKVCTGCAAMHQAFSTLSKTLSEGLEAPLRRCMKILWPVYGVKASNTPICPGFQSQ